MGWKCIRCDEKYWLNFIDLNLDYVVKKLYIS